MLLLIVGLGALLWLTMASREPSYHDKPLNFWLSRATDSGTVLYNQKDPNVIECRETIRSIGTNAIPMLLRILKAKDSAVKKVAMDLVERQDYVKFPIRSAEDQKQKAQAGFYLLGDLASNAAPALPQSFVSTSDLPPDMDDHIVAWMCSYFDRTPIDICHHRAAGRNGESLVDGFFSIGAQLPATGK